MKTRLTHRVVNTLIAAAFVLGSAASAQAATASFVGNVLDGGGGMVLNWYDGTFAKSFDADANDQWGTAGYSIFRGNAGGGGADTWNVGISEVQAAGLSLMQAGAGGAGLLLQVGDSFAANDWVEPTNIAGPLRNMGYAGLRSTGAAVPLSQAFTFAVTTDFTNVLRMGIVADGLGDARLRVDQLRVVVGASSVDATIVANPANTQPDMYFFDLDGLKNGDLIEIWTAGLTPSASFVWPTLNGVTFDLGAEVSGDGGEVPAPAALPAGLALIGLLAARRRR